MRPGSDVVWVRETGQRLIDVFGSDRSLRQRDEGAREPYHASRIGGVECDHVAIRQPDVDWQVWIEKGDAPLPRKVVITTKTQPTQPQYIATLKWDTSASIDRNLFAFTPPADAVRIRFARRAN